MRAGDGELHALVLADRPAENRAVLGVGGGAIDEELPVADALGGDEDALGIHPVEDVAEALAFFPDQVLGGDFEIVEEEFRRGVVQHGADGLDRQAVAFGRLHVDQQHAHAVGWLGRFIARAGAAEKHHEVRMLGAADPDLGAIDDVGIALLACNRLAPGKCLDARRVRAAGRLGDAEGLQPQLAARDLRQVALLLLLGAVPQQRSHGVHLRMARRAIAAGAMDFLQHRARRRNPEARAAILLRDQDRQPALLGQRLDELCRILPLAIQRPPVSSGKPRTQLAHGLADFGMGLLFAHAARVSLQARLRQSCRTSRVAALCGLAMVSAI